MLNSVGINMDSLMLLEEIGTAEKLVEGFCRNL
jgi:hypothetical protein